MENTKKRNYITIISVLLLLLFGSVVYIAISLVIGNKHEDEVIENNHVENATKDPMLEYVCSKESVYILESGLIKFMSEFKSGNTYEIRYELENPDYEILIQDYKIDEIAGTGTESEKAINLMNEFSGRLTHLSNYDNKYEISAVPLLKYSLDNPEHGLNCKNKAQIFNGMCLALNIYCRKVWLMPNSSYDDECHVVNEVWDTTLNKWVMVDISNNIYWVDENGTKLSVLEIRDKIANQEFCTPVYPMDGLEDLENSLQNSYGLFLYYGKNMVWFQYLSDNGAAEGEDTRYNLVPECYEVEDGASYISKEAIDASPIK